MSILSRQKNQKIDMSSNQDNAISFRDKQMKKALNERGQAPGLVAKQICDRYFYLMQRCTPKFTEAEASLIVDVLNGSRFQTETIEYIVKEVVYAIREEGYAQKWVVNGDVLIGQIKNLNLSQLFALVDAVERFWYESESYYVGDNMSKRLKKVGLIK